MSKSEVLILIVVLGIGGLAFLLERLSPDAVRVLAIAVCTLLLLLTFVGMFMRAKVKRARSQAEAPENTQEAG